MLAHASFQSIKPFLTLLHFKATLRVRFNLLDSGVRQNDIVGIGSVCA
jgi:hypothetical protein